ncbi:MULTISPECIES: RluA family pseudouridine synthase [Peribacillus]|uniref:Pseudouridine synthase n=1 Tax=Peribacillus butanolivorans TaxID=421767 RepID=A0AAX0S6H5_9BACI|nr:RluA family pseudouridine synthase [Peribacillus butanolivorans]KQU17055.1 RNA pseudouridine synthase [Bacillus sp. Leaf13]KRF62680.1 RNA pseudouridine synthase [Bacillus sp. Soil768D1]AXN40211.1 RluA family pseudouridine synthase [Peribacillus butanolivorans]KON68178.1 pseudouridine synthase [Peribacillus butanolivorans]PEJ36847.1 pseudouridine synthase [Peribacillus butanolivorans]
MSNQNFSLTWSVSEEDSGSLLREFLSKYDISKRALTDIKFKGGLIKVNGLEVTVRERIKTGDSVTVIFPPEQASEGLLPEPIPLLVRYEDEFVLVVVKPPSMNTIPSREHPNGSLANGLAGYYKKMGIHATIHIVTRLDRDTSGLVLIAKHRHIHHLLSEQQKSGQVKRRYQAIAEGLVNGPKGMIEAPIGRKSTSIIEREVREDGRYACTLFEVLAQTETYTFLNLELLTGRTHQIRVHMAHIGHPLAGDDLYGGHREMIARQALHCFELKFLHPFTKKVMLFQEKLPQDMIHLLDGN